MAEQATHVAERRRRGDGVKLASDCWRTFNGEVYPAWTSFPSADRIAAYRAGGVRCRRVGVELFVHHEDHQRAAEIDAKEEGR